MSDQPDLVGLVTAAIGTVMDMPQVRAALGLAAWGMLIAWLATVAWILKDASRRSSSPLVAAGAGAATLLASPFAFVLVIVPWLLVRPRQTLAEVEEHLLTVAALEATGRHSSCPGCAAVTMPDWRRCPWCATWLLLACPRCDRGVEPQASICPWCAADLPETPRQPSPLAPVGTAAPRRRFPVTAAVAMRTDRRGPAGPASLRQQGT